MVCPFIKASQVTGNDLFVKYDKQVFLCKIESKGVDFCENI